MTMRTKVKNVAEWCAVIGDLLMEEDFEVFPGRESLGDHCFLQVEKPLTSGQANLVVYEDGSIDIIDLGIGNKVKEALRKRGYGGSISATTRALDFENEDDVLFDMSMTLEMPPDSLSITNSFLESFNRGTVWEVSSSSSSGRSQWAVVQDDDQVEALAHAVVSQDLEQEPELFNRDFLMQHIDEGRLRRALRPDVVNMKIDDLTDDASRRPDDFWKDYERALFVAPEENNEGQRQPSESEIEELAAHYADEQLQDPMQYLEDVFGAEDAVTRALEIAPINIARAAEAAVEEDGAGHFLSHYDGEIRDSVSGFRYWRVN